MSPNVTWGSHRRNHDSNVQVPLVLSPEYLDYNDKPYLFGSSTSDVDIMGAGTYDRSHPIMTASSPDKKDSSNKSTVKIGVYNTVSIP